MEDKYYVINGTLVHADQYDELKHWGIKGMKWGRHLPGTDWWKEATQSYYAKNNVSGNKVKDVDEKGKVSFNTTYTPTLGQKIKANVNVAGQAAKKYGHMIGLQARAIKNEAKTKAFQKGYEIAKGTSKLWNEGKGYTKEKIEELKQFAKDAYSQSRGAVTNFLNVAKNGKSFTKNTPVTMLQEYQTKQWRDYMAAYNQSKVNGSFGNTLNKWFQNAQYGIVKGVNKYLQAFGLDDDVDKFMRKYKSSSSNGSVRRSSRNMTR